MAPKDADREATGRGEGDEEALLPGRETEGDTEALSAPELSHFQQHLRLDKSPPPGRRRGWQQALAVAAFLLLLAGGLLAVALTVGRDKLFRRQGLRFFVLGDWGRDGMYNQSLVAASMGQLAARQRPLFVVNVGDNFYESGLTSTEDTQFDTSFRDMYTHPSLQIPWYGILGNHDYGELWDVTEMPQPSNCGNVSLSECYYSPLHQLSKRLTERDWRWRCERWYQVSLSQGQVDLFFIDTSPFLQQYWDVPWAHNPGGILSESWQAQLLELEARLAASRAAWKIVVGHHPIFNNHFADTAELVEHIQPLLDRYKVQAYFSGHEHDLQYHHLAGEATHYIISGAGSLTDYPLTYRESPRSQYLHQGSGFVTCELQLAELRCSFMGLTQAESLLDVRIPQKVKRP